jgi:leader peptidase (prepilin peptidase) / N-methyltransferase
MSLILAPQSFVRWLAVIWDAAVGAMRPLETMTIAAIGVCSVAASVTLVPGLAGIAGAGLATLMFAIAAVDARRFIIPDELTAAALLLGFLRAAIEAFDDLAQALALSALRGVVLVVAFLGLRATYRWFRGRHGLGLGDVKLLCVAGVWLDWAIIPIALEIAAVAALGTYLIRHFCCGLTVRLATRLPFGLFLAPAIWIGWLLEATILYPWAPAF